MNSFERTMARIHGEKADSLPAHPLFMVYAADLIGEKYSDYILDFNLLVKGQIAVAEKFGADLVSCCSDAYREAADCGARLMMFDRQPPCGEEPLLKSPSDLLRLKKPDPLAGGRMTDRLEAIRSFASQVKGEIPILGWVEGPVAESADLFGINEFLLSTIDAPDFTADLMDWVVDMEIDFALRQIEAGADIIGIGDAAASLVSPRFYANEALIREKKIIDAIHDAGALCRLHICGSLKGKMDALAKTGADIIDIDYPQTIAEARGYIPGNICLCGNLNPVSCLKAGNPNQIKSDFAECFRQSGGAYFVAPGCEVPVDTPEENIRAMFDFARDAEKEF